MRIYSYGGINIEEIVIDFPKRLDNQHMDIIFLSNLWHSLKNRKSTKIILDMTNTKNISINICSSLGVILEKIKLRKNSIFFRNIPNNIRFDLIENEFLKGIENQNKQWNGINFLGYKKFTVREKESFEEYLIERIGVFAKENSLTCDVKKIVRAISEIFVNVKMHTLSKEVVTCGYYDDIDKVMYFTITNHGITISKNIERKNDYVFNKEVEAIEWAIKKSSSTRNDTETGGLGLYTTRKFINEINGSMWIASGRGYWHQQKEKIEKMELKSSFPGTIITFRIPLDYVNDINKKIEKDIISIQDIIGGEVW